LQFEQLCARVLELEAGIEPSAWDGDADRHRGFVQDQAVTLRGTPLKPPVIVRCLWLPKGEHARERRLNDAAQGLAKRIVAMDDPKPSLLTFVNAGPEELDNPNIEFQLDGQHRDLSRVVYGERELAAAIDQHASLRLDLPSVLSLGDTRARLDADALRRSSLDLDAALELAPVFVPTEAYARALGTLRRHAFLVMTGPPEMGKTAIARMLGLALLSDGWEVHECTRPEQVWERLDPERKQLFVADDAFGSAEYRPDAAERWARDLDRALRATDENHWLVWTSRPAPLHSGLRRIHRERGGERFPQPAAVQVDAADLSPPEKTLILYRHTRAADLTPAQRRLTYEHGRAIVAHPHFTPERIRRSSPAACASWTRARRGRGRGCRAERADAGDGRPLTPRSPRSTRAAAGNARLAARPGRRARPRGRAAPAREQRLSHAPVDLVERLTDHFVRVLR
jgi:hypothetical protein